MRRVSCAAFVAASISLCSPAAAQNWVFYARNSGAVYRYDTTSVERNGREVRVWIFADYTASIPIPQDPYTKSLVSIDCAAWTYRRLSRVTVNANGRAVGPQRRRRPLRPALRMPPRTHMAVLAGKLCR